MIQIAGDRRLVKATLALSLAGCVMVVAPSLASASISQAELAKLRSLAASEARSLKIKHPGLAAVQATYPTYRNAFPDGAPATVSDNQIYVVQVAGTFRAAGHTFKALELIVSRKTSHAEAGIYSTAVERLGRLGRVYTL